MADVDEQKSNKHRRIENKDSASPNKHHLRALGFCGADDSSPPELLAALSARYNYIEWGVLFRDELQGTPRYASQAWLDRLGEVNADRAMLLAAHLCSTRCTQVLNGDSSFVASLHDKYGFKRFQVNATAANNVDMGGVNKEGAARLRSVMVALPHVEFILQRNEETKPLWQALESGEGGELGLPLPPNVSFLFDESKGTGVVAAEWPSPPPGVGRFFGYAGGLGPTTLEAQLPRMAARMSESSKQGEGEVRGNGDSGAGATGRDFWVDMESSLRTIVVETGSGEEEGSNNTRRDTFDVCKCVAAVRIVEAAARAGVLAMPAAR
mmetsp:Transcript_20155/g.36553  ORF Transcript_20155/g.36553 Transcript_20155/m.36553 type:complete len:324 (+) Transcript_20155:25-996(+)